MYLMCTLSFKFVVSSGDEMSVLCGHTVSAPPKWPKRGPTSFKIKINFFKKVNNFLNQKSDLVFSFSFFVLAILCHQTYPLKMANYFYSKSNRQMGYIIQFK